MKWEKVIVMDASGWAKGESFAVGGWVEDGWEEGGWWNIHKYTDSYHRRVKLYYIKMIMLLNPFLLWWYYFSYFLFHWAGYTTYSIELKQTEWSDCLSFAYADGMERVRRGRGVRMGENSCIYKRVLEWSAVSALNPNTRVTPDPTDRHPRQQPNHCLVDGAKKGYRGIRARTEGCESLYEMGKIKENSLIRYFWI